MTTTPKKELSDPCQKVVNALGALLREMTTKQKSIALRCAEVGRVLGIEIRVNAADQRMLVGGGGRHISAIKTVLRAMAAQAGYRIVAELLEPNEGNKEDAFHSFKGTWPAKEIKALMEILLEAMLPDPAAYALSVENMEKVCVLHVATEASLPDETWEALRTLFDAIGKSKGTIIEMEMNDEQHETDNAKPVGAD